MFLEAKTLNKPVSLDLTLGPEGLAKYKKEPGIFLQDWRDQHCKTANIFFDETVTIKEGAEFSVGIKFR